MPNELELPGKTVDLDKVKGLDEDEYRNLVYYARQWDSPNEIAWVDAIEAARGGKSLPPTTEDDLPTETGEFVLETASAHDIASWVGDDPARAAEALGLERDRANPRPGLVKRLDRVANK